MSNISTKLFAMTDVSHFIQMSRQEYGETTLTNAEHLQWKHVNSPIGASSYVGLYDDGILVGRTLAQPRFLCTQSKKFRVASIMDMLIDAKYRTTPMNFIKIIKACGELSEYDLVYHTSNERSEPLYDKLLRYRKPFSLKAYVFPLKLSNFFAKIIGRKITMLDWLTIPWRFVLKCVGKMLVFFTRLDIAPSEFSADELEQLSERCIEQEGPMLERTTRFLQWRFKEAPLWGATIYRINKAGKFYGYLVTRTLELEGINYLVLMDFLIEPNVSLWGRLAIRFWLINHTITAKVDAFFTMLNPSSQSSCKCAGFPFFPLPEKYLPHATPIFMRPAHKECEAFKTENSIHMTLVDIDYF